MHSVSLLLITPLRNGVQGTSCSCEGQSKAGKLHVSKGRARREQSYSELIFIWMPGGDSWGGGASACIHWPLPLHMQMTFQPPRQASAALHREETHALVMMLCLKGAAQPASGFLLLFSGRLSWVCRWHISGFFPPAQDHLLLSS